MSWPGALSSPKWKFLMQKVVTPTFGGCNECVKVSDGEGENRRIFVGEGAASSFCHGRGVLESWLMMSPLAAHEKL